ncbi:MAG: MFS transporter [Anaerolineales bacterium]
MQPTQDKKPLLSPILRWFLFAMILANIAASMYPILLPIYMTEIGASVQDVGLAFTLSSVVMLVLQVFGGWVSDSIGRLKAIAIGSVGGIIGFIALAIAPTWQWMMVAVMAVSFPRSLVGPSFGAFIAENSDEENRGKVFGITETIYQVVGIIGPLSGGLLAGLWGFKGMLIVSAVIYTIAAGLRIWMATTMKPTDEQPTRQELSTESFKISFKRMWGMIIGGGLLTWLLVTDGVRDTAFRLSGELQPLFLEQIGGLTVQQIGLLGSIFSFSMMFTPILSGKLSDRYGERLPISVGFLMLFAGMIVFLNTGVYAGFILSWVISGFGVGLLSPAYQSLVSKAVPHHMLGIFNGVFYSSIGLISLPMPYIGAYLWEHINPRFPFYITAFVALLTVIPSWLFFKLPDKKEEQSPNLHTSEALPVPEPGK